MIEAKHFASSNVEWEEMVSKASKWMNDHIAPHEFVGLAVFDDHHPIDKEN